MANIDADFPPGTLRLEELRTASSAVILHPIPTDDPNDPLNWSFWRKSVNFALANFFVVITFVLVDIGVVIYGPYNDIGIDDETINNGWALNYAGLAVGCILFIPFVYRYGRRPVYIFSMLFQFAATIWNAKLKTGGELLAAYTLAGIGGAISETIVQITIGDLYFVHQRATANGIFITMQNIGSFFGPVVAGYIAVAEGWRWIWWWAAIFLAVNFILVVFFFEETTYIPTVVGRSAVPAVAQDGDPQQQTRKPDDDFVKQPSPALEETPSLELQPHFKPKTYRERLALWTVQPHQPGDFKKHFYQPFVVLFAFPAVLYAAFTYGALLSWYTVVTLVESENFIDPPYNWDSSQIGLLNLAPFIGGLIGSALGGPLSDYTIMWMAKRNNGIYEPEMRLWLSLPTIIICPLSILMFGFGMAREMSWVFVAFGWALSSMGQNMAVDVCLTYVTDSYRDIIGTAIIGVVFVRNGISVIVSFAATPWVNNLGLQNCFISVAVLAFVFQLLPIPLLIWGKQIRQHTAQRYRELSQYQPTKRG